MIIGDELDGYATKAGVKMGFDLASGDYPALTFSVPVGSPDLGRAARAVRLMSSGDRRKVKRGWRIFLQLIGKAVA